jgi:hypothetical protein
LDGGGGTQGLCRPREYISCSSSMGYSVSQTTVCRQIFPIICWFSSISCRLLPEPA